jgi:hypothetical protein
LCMKRVASFTAAVVRLFVVLEQPIDMAQF